MRACSREVFFRNGISIETPLLVPSLSSKGFLDLEVEGRKRPAPAGYTETFGGASFIDSLLISAYDISHAKVDDAAALYDDFARSPYSQTPFLIIDNGWYEATPGSDFGQPYEENRDPEPWGEQRFEATVDALSGDIRGALVAWDRTLPYPAQITAAQEFFATRPGFVSTLLLKPTGDTARLHRIAELIPVVRDLRAFDIVGVTEKELGNTITKRLVVLAQLHDAMREADVEAPIHVFGGLDPLFTPLYFAFGAEIVDGLSWLRYAYHDEMSVYRDAMLLVEEGFPDKRTPLAITTIQARNLDFLLALKRLLKLFHDEDGNWAVFQRGDILRRVAAGVDGELGRRRVR